MYILFFNNDTTYVNAHIAPLMIFKGKGNMKNLIFKVVKIITVGHTALSFNAGVKLLTLNFLTFAGGRHNVELFCIETN